MKIIVKGKLVTWVQDLWPENLEALNIIRKKFLLNLIRKSTITLYNLNDALIGQSQSYVKVLKKRTIKKVYYVPNYSEIFKSRNKRNINDCKCF